MTDFATDKIGHGYFPDYQRLADELGPAAVVCEVGVLFGDSLDLWKHFFPSSPALIGVDHDPAAQWRDGTVRIVAEQDDPDLRAKVAAHLPAGTCDLVVDDASHIGHLTGATYAQLWPLVRPGGYYVIEDWADPWLHPEWLRWPQVNPELEGDELIDYVPALITALKDGAQSVEYTREGLVIIRRQP